MVPINVFNQPEKMTEFDRKLFQELARNTKFIRDDAEGIEDIKRAISIINSPFVRYNDLTYFFQTENLRYIGQIAPEERETAFTITGQGNSILELINQGFNKIVTTDTNPLSKYVLKLLMAAARTLSSKDYDKFLLNSQNRYFLSYDVFKSIREGFMGDEAAINFWDAVLINDKEDLLTYFFKPITSDCVKTKYGVPFIKKYHGLKEKLEQAEVEIHSGDAIDLLEQYPEREYNYIDITNILLFAYQAVCGQDDQKYRELLDRIKNIYDKNLKNGGVFVFDYYFGISTDTLQGKKETTLVGPAEKAYKGSYNYFSNEFDLESMSLTKLVNIEEIENDTVIYTKKRK